MSLGKLIALTVLDLVLALAIAFGGVFLYAWTIAPTTHVGLVHVGQALGLPLRDDSEASRWGHDLDVACTAVPDDDRGLKKWFSALPGVTKVHINRTMLAWREQGETQLVRVRFKGPEGMPKPDVPWKELNYKLGEPKPWITWAKVQPAVAFN